MNRDDIKKYLRMLGHELQKKHMTAEILVADEVMLFLDIRRPERMVDIDTHLMGPEKEQLSMHRRKDIDVYFGKNGAVTREAAANIADCEGLPDDWLRQAVWQFFFSQPSHEKWLEYSGVRIYLSPLDELLAMKVATACSPRDSEDIQVLAKKLHISQVQGMYERIAPYIPTELLTPQMCLVVEQCFE